MSSRGTYRSKYYEQILDYLKSYPGKHFHVNDIHKDLAERGSSIGVTTIYRQLDRMVEAGVVNKYIIDPGTPACYEYTEETKTAETEPFFHCLCQVCGGLIHFQCEEIEDLQGHFLKEHHFQIDPFRTVFYGTCENCMMQEISAAEQKSCLREHGVKGKGAHV